MSAIAQVTERRSRRAVITLLPRSRGKGRYASSWLGGFVRRATSGNVALNLHTADGACKDFSGSRKLHIIAAIWFAAGHNFRPACPNKVPSHGFLRITGSMDSRAESTENSQREPIRFIVTRESSSVTPQSILGAHYGMAGRSDIERILVVSDGTFTCQLEMFVREPIGVEILSNELAPLSSSDARFLECSAGRLAWDRRTFCSASRFLSIGASAEEKRRLNLRRGKSRLKRIDVVARRQKTPACGGPKNRSHRGRH